MVLSLSLLLWALLSLAGVFVAYYESMRVIRRLYGRSAAGYSNDVKETVFLVTGGAGALGTHLVRELCALQAKEVRVFDLATGSLPGVEYVQGNICDVSALRDAMRGVDTVFHMASLIDYHGHRDALLRTVNVEGTRAVLEAARAAKVKKVVYTSSTAVLTDGNGFKGSASELPYPEHPVDMYGKTKAAAERLVLLANGVGGVLTCSIRFHIPYGIGCLINEVYMDYQKEYVVFDFPRDRIATPIACQNVVHAHLCAHKTLTPGSVVAGKPYIVGDKKLSYFDLASAQREQMGLCAPVVRSKWLGWVLCVVFEYTSLLSMLLNKLSFGLVPLVKPLVTRAQLCYAYDNHDVDLEPARRELQFEPVISFEEANKVLGVHYRSLLDKAKKD